MNARNVMFPLALLGLVACGPSKEVQQRLAELETVSAAKDSLLTEVTANAQLISDISAEIARVQADPALVAGASEAPVAVTRANVLNRVEALTARIEASETRLAESQERMDSLTRDRADLKKQLAGFRKAAESFQTTIANQKESIAALTDQVNSLKEENTRLATENTTLAQEKETLTDTVSAITERASTVYYVVGTKDDLLQRGIVTEEGGSRVLFIFGKRGKTLVPARDLDSTVFTPIDMHDVLEIPLPSDREYRIASRQDLSALETAPDDDGRFHGTIRIANPDQFWASNHFLIIVES